MQENFGKNRKISEKIGKILKKSENFGKNQKISEKIGKILKKSENFGKNQKISEIFLEKLVVFNSLFLKYENLFLIPKNFSSRSLKILRISVLFFITPFFINPY